MDVVTVLFKHALLLFIVFPSTKSDIEVIAEESPENIIRHYTLILLTLFCIVEKPKASMFFF